MRAGSRGGARAWRPGLLALPYGVGLVVLVGLPLLAAGVLAFTDYHGFTAPTFVGWANLERAWSDPLVHQAARTTALLALFVVPARALLSVAAALLLSRPGRGVPTARAAVFLPSVVPDTAWALLWLWLLNPQFGPLAAASGSGMGLLTEPWPTRLGLAAMLTLQLGEGFVVCLAARRALPSDVYEAAAVEGASTAYTLRRVTLPLMAPVVGLLAVRDVVLVATTTFVPVLLLTGGGPRESTLTLPLHLYLQGFRYGDLGYVSMLSLLLLLLTALALLPLFLVARRLDLLR